MLGILKKKEAGYIRGVMDHLGADRDETGLEKDKNHPKKQEPNECSTGWNLPVEQQQQGQHR